MSGIGGIFNLDDSPVDRELLRRMTERIGHRGPDGTGYWSNGPVGLAHQRLCTTPESVHERQPLLNESGTLCLAFDGRVDNREDLQAALTAKRTCLRDDTDVELVLKAYEAWGEDSPEKILGDFAYAIWDGRHRRLFCARDILGLKPFYYFTNGRIFLFGSELRQLHEYEELPRDANEGMIAEYLANQITSREETFWQNIMRLPPAHFLVIEPGRASRKVCYWDIAFSRQIRYKTDQEYAGHFLNVFKEAVHCRMRSHKPAGAELSGGLDSSSVVCVGEWLRRQRTVSVPGFETFSLIFPGRDCDESSYIQSVLGKWRLQGHSIGEDPPGIPWYRGQIAKYLDYTDYPNGAMACPLFRTAARRQVRVLLNGHGGDHWFEGPRHWEWQGFTSSLRTHLSLLFKMARNNDVASTIRYTANRGQNLLVHAGLSRRVVAQEIPYWITPELARRTALRDRINPPRFGPESDPAQRQLIGRLHSGRLAHVNEIEERSYSDYGLEGRSPFFDRRIIEFAGGVPADQLGRGKTTKVVLRGGMATFLPEDVRLRSTKAEFGHTFGQGLADPDAKAMFSSLLIAEMRWVNPAVAQQLYTQLVRAFSRGMPLENIWPVWMILGAELWSRHFQK